MLVSSIVGRQGKVDKVNEGKREAQECELREIGDEESDKDIVCFYCHSKGHLTPMRGSPSAPRRGLSTRRLRREPHACP